jgi:hypothetical protein
MLSVSTRPRHRNSRKADFMLRAPQFRQWLRGRDCLLADKGGCSGKIEAAHVDYAGGKGVGLKVHDRFSIPLCSEHHRVQHGWGWDTFEQNFKLGIGGAKEAAAQFWAAWPGRRAWEAERG